MKVRMIGVLRFFLQILIVLLQAALWTWAACLPLVWILRDGLGPDSVDSRWPTSVVKFVTMWSIPALTLAVPLLILSRVERRMRQASKANLAP
jgi:hypothetical protein